MIIQVTTCLPMTNIRAATSANAISKLKSANFDV